MCYFSGYSLVDSLVIYISMDLFLFSNFLILLTILKYLNWKIIQIFVCKKLTVVFSDALPSLYN